MNLNGKCAIVTGGSMGIGKAIAMQLARRGANVFLIARREEPLKAAIAEMRKQSPDASHRFGYFTADVADLGAVQEAVREAEKECGPAVVLVNSAGVPLAGYVEKLPLSDIETEIKVNYLGTVYACKQVLDGMIERREGWILNISSLAGLKGIFGYTGYSGSKFAVLGFSEALRSELRPYHVRVSVLCPPDVDTERALTDTREKPVEMQRISKGAKRMQPDEVARAAIEGMEKGTFILIPGFSGKLLNVINRITPRLVNIFLDRTVDKARRERGLQGAYARGTRQMDLNGKCAIVTGGSSGIGKSMAKELAQRGANVFLIARRQDVLQAALEEVQNKARSESQRFGSYGADVAQLAAVQEAIRRAEAQCGPATVLVNSAGFVNPGYVEESPISSMETEMAVNYLGTVYMIKQVLNEMIERREGWILNISSLGGLKGIFGYTGYSGSKFAVVGFSEALRSELRPYGVKVSVLCPPDVNTPMFTKENEGKPLETLRISEGAKIMEPEDVACAAIKGMEKGSFLIIPNFPGKMFSLANRLVPSILDKFLDSTVDKVRRERGLQEYKSEKG